MCGSTASTSARAHTTTCFSFSSRIFSCWNPGDHLFWAHRRHGPSHRRGYLINQSNDFSVQIIDFNLFECASSLIAVAANVINSFPFWRSSLSTTLWAAAAHVTNLYQDYSFVFYGHCYGLRAPNNIIKRALRTAVGQTLPDEAIAIVSMLSAVHGRSC